MKNKFRPFLPQFIGFRGAPSFFIGSLLRIIDGVVGAMTAGLINTMLETSWIFWVSYYGLNKQMNRGKNGDDQII